MNKLGKVKFSGGSGVRYDFRAYPLETVFDKGFSGVYVITQRKQGKSKSGFVHKRISTGQSDGLRQPLTADGRPFDVGGANCICVHGETDKNARQRIEQDLIRRPRAGQA